MACKTAKENVMFGVQQVLVRMLLRILAIWGILITWLIKKKLFHMHIIIIVFYYYSVSPDRLTTVIT
jgi:mannose/fructose/N-acetylgalactosamine-specific phosphotransferase system component IID